jgi:small subunit ribosomal protein S14
MAKKSLVAKNRQRQALVDKFKAQRAELRARSKDLKLTLEERMEARAALTLLPSNSAATKVTGRTHGYLRKFGVCRNAVRLLAHQGDLPGVTKASW